jgi:hypothetical protein
VTRYSKTGRTQVAQPIEQAPAWVRELISSREQREAQHAEAQAILDAIRRGDWSRVMTAEELIRQMDAPDGVDEPGGYRVS